MFGGRLSTHEVVDVSHGTLLAGTTTNDLLASFRAGPPRMEYLQPEGVLPIKAEEDGLELLDIPLADKRRPALVQVHGAAFAKNHGHPRGAMGPDLHP